MHFDEKYLSSSNFNNLCLALDFLPKDVEEIKRKVKDLKDKTNLKDSIAMIIYEQMLNYRDIPSKRFSHKSKYFRWLADDSYSSPIQYFCQVYIRKPEKWDEIKSKLKAGIHSEKICSDYLFEKEYPRELDLISAGDVNDALNAIYLHEIYYLVKIFNIKHDDVKKFFKHACMNGYYAHPLYFDEVRDAFEKSIKIVLKKPLDRIKDLSYINFMNGFSIIENEMLTHFVEDIFKKSDENYSDDFADCMLVHSHYLPNGGTVFYVIACGGSNGFKPRNDFSDVVCIKRKVVENSNSVHIRKDSDLVNSFSEFILDDFRKKYLELGEGQLSFFDDFIMERFENADDGKSWHVLDAVDNDYDVKNLYEIASQKPLCEEFLALVSSLNMTVDDALKIRSSVKNSYDVLKMLDNEISSRYSKEALSKEELSNHLERLYVKAVLLLKYNKWDEIKSDLTAGIDSDEISSSYELHRAFDEAAKSDFKINILYGQIISLLEFRELDFKYGEKLAFYLQDKDILDNELCIYLNEILIPPVKEKKYCDKGKYAAPRWLVYPELDAYTIGWRMGYGEEYAMNEPWRDNEFYALFPKPQNWLFNPRNSDIERFPMLGFFWTSDGRPKYSQISDDYIEVNEFITVEQMDCEFQYDS